MTTLESQVEVTTLPPYMRLRGALWGIPIIESNALKYDEMFIGSVAQFGIVVGEEAHFLWRMKMIDLNNACREQARRDIEDWGTRILGEPWKVSEH